MNTLPPHANDRLPEWPGFRLWVCALLLAVAFLAALEFLWRSQGFVPSITDDFALWALQREKLETASPKTVALLGRSRMLQSFVPATFHGLLPDWDFAQLSIDMKHPLGTLRDIAENTGFSGVVVCSVTSPSLLPELWDQQQEYLDYYHKQWNPLDRLARQIKSAMEQRFTLLLPNLLLHQALPDLLRGKLEPQFLLQHPDRCQQVDYKKLDLEEQSRQRLVEIKDNYEHYMSLPGFKQWPTHLPVMEEWVREIHDRGGKVVFLFPPLSGEYQAAKEAYMPRSQFWDLFAKQTRAFTLHCEDLSVLKDRKCAEGSHLFWEDCPVFTLAVFQELKDRGICR